LAVVTDHEVSLKVNSLKIFKNEKQWSALFPQSALTLPCLKIKALKAAVVRVMAAWHEM